jgi:alkanesulfonate monooxygenase SsuD/methylene tetrahydromethanopterin reductase-like flavin-dependent oxidoreductase (luciferase family)
MDDNGVSPVAGSHRQTGERTVTETLDRIREYVARAKSMPMSASVMVNRSELAALVDELAAAVEQALAESRTLVASQESVIDEGQQVVAAMITEAERERERITSDSEVFKHGKREAERIVADALAEAEGLRKDADDYVDGKLANFEITLQRTLEAVRRGRERLLGRSALDSLGSDEVDSIQLPDTHGRH